MAIDSRTHERARGIRPRCRQRRWSSPIGSALLGIGILVAAGCGGGPERSVIHDLAAELPHATVRVPTGRIDLEDASSVPAMVGRWLPAAAGEAREATWSLGATAVLDTFILADGDLDLVLRCGAGDASSEGSAMRVELNGTEIGTVTLSRGIEEHRLTVAAEVVRSGRNRLRFEVVGGGDGTRLRWEEIVLGDGTAPTAERPETTTDAAMRLPAGVRVDYYLVLPAASEVAFAELRGPGPGRRAVEVRWSPALGDGGEVVTTVRTGADRRVRLGNSDLQIGRLSLRATGSGPVEIAGAVVEAPGAADAPDAAPTAAASRQAPTTRPNIVIYLIDALRSDHLGCYGYERDTSPNIDAFTEQAILFTDSQAQSSWTRSSVATVLTGLLPQQHGAVDRKDVLADEALTLAERLQAAGYRTAAITSNGNVAEPFGFAQGFDHFEYLRNPRPGEKIARSTDVHAAVVEWLDGAAADEPFFLYIHTVDPHAPYEPPEPFRSELASGVTDRDLGSIESVQRLAKDRSMVTPEIVADMVDLYDGEIAANDASFGRLADELKVRGLYDDALVVVMSDHGEEFFDHGGWTHGKTLHAEVLDVPLIVKMPGAAAGARAGGIVDHVDLMPTLLQVAGLKASAELPGTSLLSRLERRGFTDHHEHAVAHLQLGAAAGVSYADAQWKVIVPVVAGVRGYPEVYDRAADPAEEHDLGLGRPILGEYLAALIERIEAGARFRLEAGTVTDAEEAQVEDQLRALGYL